MATDSSDTHASSGFDWLVGGGEMGALIKAKDWSLNPLGPRNNWPELLRSVVNLCLNSSAPISIAWGENFAHIYNDSYRNFCGSKHPESLGQDFRLAWAESWHLLSEAFSMASEGQASPLIKRRVFLDRVGYLEETFFASSCSPIFDAGGRVAGVLHQVTEITDQVLGERRLRVIQSITDRLVGVKSVEAAFTETVNTLKRHKLELPFVLIYVVDPSEDKARLCAASGLESAGDDVRASLIDLQNNASIWPVDQVLASGETMEVADLSGRASVVCSPYEEPVEEVVLMPLALDRGEHPNVVLIAGVSARKRLDTPYRNFFSMLRYTIEKELSHARAYERVCLQTEALEEQDRLKTTFFTQISHELRTPLTLLIGPVSEMLKTGSNNLAEMDVRRLEIVHRNALRLMKLVNALLDFAQIEAGRAEPGYAPVDLPTRTRELASMFESAFELAGVEFHIDCPESPEPAYVDPGMWEKIVLNLLSNAFKFTATGDVSLSLRTLADHFELTVEDTGIGIEERELTRIFERFHRGGFDVSRQHRGSGIGLSLVKEMVNMHSGTIRAESRAVGGSRFTVCIPRGKSHLREDRVSDLLPQESNLAGLAYIAEAVQWLGNDSADATSDSPDRARKATSPRVLVVEDTADMRRYLYDILSPFCWVETVSDAERALEILRQDPPDLLISDLMMPNVDGYELTKQIRLSEDTSRLPVILLSARADEQTRVAGLRSGADDYLIKPFSVSELIARVQLHLNAGNARKRAIERAQHDDLTDLPNRVLIYEFIERLIGSAERAQARMAVLFIDMDRFKPINDDYGHATGDAVLLEVADRLSRGLREEDSVGRIGGDEFLAALSHIHAAPDAAMVARHLVDSLSEPYVVDGHELTTTPSIGIALFPEDGKTPDELAHAADQAMYMAKLAGPGQVRFCSKQVNQQLRKSSLIEQRFERAFSQGEFEMHYQPVVDYQSGQLTSVEAFTRWRGSKYGPREFLPVAERCGLMEPFGDWIIQQVCQQLRVWGDEGLSPLTVSINVSPEQCHQLHLFQHLMRSTAQNGLSPGSLQIEMTALQLHDDNGSDTAELLHKLKSAGFKLALDHFGNEASNLASLIEYAPDCLKLDDALSELNGGAAQQLKLVNGIVTLGAAMGFRVVAEHVENAATLTALQSVGCRDFQGFHICPPLAANDFAHWYQGWRSA